MTISKKTSAAPNPLLEPVDELVVDGLGAVIGVEAGGREHIDRTWDNGSEASCHQLVDESLGMLTYFADPYSSWQRGTNENRNGRIHRYLPKKTSFDGLTQSELDAIVRETDDTPMKILGYKTPNEVWDEEITGLQSHNINPTTGVALAS